MNTPSQHPLHTGFSPATTADEALAGQSLHGKIAIVTGGSSGIGLETTRTLHAAGATLIVPARDTQKAAAALHDLPNIQIEPMELLDPASITTFTQKFLASGRPLHLLINSAGIMANPLTRDPRGYESQFATNHLGHFQLTTQLLPALRRANGARVVAVSSWGHRFSPVHLGDPNFNHRPYDPFQAYGQSKTANILFALELDKRFQADNIRAFSLHPGTIVDTGLSKHISREQLRAAGAIDDAGKPIIDPAMNRKTPQQGAATSIWCAVSPQLNHLGGLYCENCDVAPLIPRDMEAFAKLGGKSLGVLHYAVDPAIASQLWQLSEQLTK